MSGIEVRPVSGHTGADIVGVDLRRALSDADVATSLYSCGEILNASPL